MRVHQSRVLTAAAFALFLATPSWAAEFTFLVDPAQSALTLSGSAFSSTPGGDPLFFDPQQPSSMIAPYSGSIIVDLTATTIELRGGTLDATATGSYLPGPAAADYGFQADTGNPLIGSLVGAVRDAAYELTGAAVPFSATADGFEFDVAGSLATGTAGAVDFDGAPPTSILGMQLAGLSVPLTGVTSTSVAGLNGEPASFATDGVVETLRLPLSILYHDFLPTAEIDFALEGTIVATRFVPEPATWCLLAVTGVMSRRRR